MFDACCHRQADVTSRPPYIDSPAMLPRYACVTVNLPRDPDTQLTTWQSHVSSQIPSRVHGVCLCTSCLLPRCLSTRTSCSCRGQVCLAQATSAHGCLASFISVKACLAPVRPKLRQPGVHFSRTIHSMPVAALPIDMNAWRCVASTNGAIRGTFVSSPFGAQLQSH